MKSALATLLLAAGLSVAALAQDRPEFDEVDANGDGMISQEEAGAVEGLDFARVDANKDGHIDREEYRQQS